MPRKSRPAPKVPTLAEFVSSAIAELPFAPDREPSDPRGFFALVAPDGADYSADDVRAAIAESIAQDRAAGLSGNDLRARYSGPGEAHAKGRGLTGPMRRKVLREYGHGSLVGKSYREYRDGEARTGSAHAREHGPLAAARAADRMRTLAEESTAVLSAKEIRAILRNDGRKVPTVRGGDESALREAHVALLLDLFSREEATA